MAGPVPVEGWTAYNIRLAAGSHTMGDGRIGAAEVMAARYLQLACDVAGRPARGLRVLDLGALEGLYGLELARHGASVVAIEGREANAEKARYAAGELGVLDRYEVRVEDVRKFGAATHGTFDVVLCLGILYHLDAADAFSLAEAVFAATRHLALFRTAVGLSDDRVERHAGRRYRGFTYREPASNWSSIDNESSFWPTRASLLNLLADVGFTSILESVAPPVLEVDGFEDAVVLACIKGTQIETLAAPEGAAERYREGRWPEDHVARRHPAQRSWLRRLGGGARMWRRVMRRS